MSIDWVSDIKNMHNKYQVHDWVKNNPDKLHHFLVFRLNFLKEELNETIKAFANSDAEEIVDGLIDLCVVAIGTLDAFGVNSHEAWGQVLSANMAKEIGIKPERPNTLGLPDLVKPKEWQPPSHVGNHGILTKAFKK